MKYLKYAVGFAALAALAVSMSGCSALGGGSPTATFKAFYDASKAKDPAGIKKTVSKGSLAMMETQAKAENKSVDDMLKDDKGTPDKMPETRNEKITGDTATLEVKGVTGNDWDTLPFVKEDGAWKIAFDKFMDDMKKKIDEKPAATP